MFARWYAFGSWRSTWAHARLTEWVRCCDVQAAAAAIDHFIDRAFQDEPGEEVEAEKGKVKRRYVSPLAPERCALDNLVEWSMRQYDMTPDQVLDFPIALHNQLYRERMLQAPESELAVVAPSDRLANAK